MAHIFQRISLAGAAVMMIALAACQSVKQGRGDILTSRIQYDVNIKSPDPDLDWWVQNIEGEKREEFLRNFIEKVYAGEVKAYDMSGRHLTVDEVKMIGNRSDTITVQRDVPPYDLFDTLIQERLSINDITRLRFLEEWKQDKGSLGVTKRVIGICPILQRYESDGSIRGYMPMFWVYFDPAYPLSN